MASSSAPSGGPTISRSGSITGETHQPAHGSGARAPQFLPANPTQPTTPALTALPAEGFGKRPTQTALPPQAERRRSAHGSGSGNDSHEGISISGSVIAPYSVTARMKAAGFPLKGAREAQNVSDAPSIPTRFLHLHRIRDTPHNDYGGEQWAQNRLKAQE